MCIVFPGAHWTGVGGWPCFSVALQVLVLGLTPKVTFGPPMRLPGFLSQGSLEVSPATLQTCLVMTELELDTQFIVVVVF